MNVTYNNKPAIMSRNGQVVLGDVGGITFQFIAIDLDGNELGATEQIKVESVSTETVTEVQAIFLAKLAMPQNVTANGTTVSWDPVQNATSYDVYADDTVLLGSVASQSSVDLTTLSGWANLPSGNHTIKIVAKADGYIDSEKSAGVEVTREAWTISDNINPRATRLVLGVYNVVNGEIGTLARSVLMNIQPGMIIQTPDTSAMTDGVKFIGWLDDGTFNASNLSEITYGDGINPLSDRYGAVWQSATYASKDDVPLSMVIDETAKALAAVKFNFASVPEGTAKIRAATLEGYYPTAYNAVIMRPADSAAGLSTITTDLTSWTTTMFALKSGTTPMGVGFAFIADDINGNKLGATEQIKVESVSTETVTEVQATFAVK